MNDEQDQQHGDEQQEYDDEQDDDDHDMTARMMKTRNKEPARNRSPLHLGEGVGVRVRSMKGLGFDV